MGDGRNWVIRQAQSADASQIASIYAYHVANGVASFDTSPRSAAETRTKIAECVERSWPFLIAEKGDQILGYAYATQFRDRPAYAWTCENSIYVAPSYTGKGIGRAMLKALIDASEAADFRQMIAVIGGAEPASVKLHRGAGFEEAGRMRSVGRKAGRWLDTIYMQRRLGSGDSEPPTV